MTDPHTKIEKQVRRHIGPLVGMAVVVVFAVGLIVYWMFEEVGNASNPRGDAPAEQPGDVGAADKGSLPSSTDQLAPPATEAPKPAPAPANP